MRPMKHTLLALLLVVPFAVAHATGSLGQVAPATQATEPQAHPSSHHPLIEVRYVLLPSTRSEPSLPKIDLGDGHSELSLWRSSLRTSLLDPSNPPPNVFVCPGVNCGGW